MKANAKFARVLIAGAAAFLFSTVAMADDLLYSLPETSGSGVNGSPQTNLGYNACENLLCGSMLGGSVYNTGSLDWHVTTLTVWAIDNEQQLSGSDVTPTPPASIATGLVLVGGNGDSGLGATTGIVSSSYTVLPAPYADSLNGANYRSPSGKYDGVWELTFNVTGLTISAGEDYVFAVGDSSGALNNDASLLALNATLCNGYTDVSPCVSDGIVAIGDGAITGYYNYLDTGINGYPSPDQLISSDVNVELEGTTVPEPTTWLLFGVGVGVLGLVRRRRG